MINSVANVIPEVLVLILIPIVPAGHLYSRNNNAEVGIATYLLFLMYVSFAYSILVPAMWAVIIMIIMYVVWVYGSRIL